MREWSFSTPEVQGVDSAKLNASIDYLKANFPAYKSISIFRNCSLVFENINEKPVESVTSKVIRNIMSGVGQLLGFPKGTFKENETDKWNIRSVTKSIISILIGIAIKEGFINSIHDTLDMFFKDYLKGCHDEEKKTISIKNLLTMKSGLSTIDKGLEPLLFMKSRDWVEYIIKRPLQASPGSSFEYNSANTHLLSAIITRTTGMNAATFAKKHLFAHLEIVDFLWESDPKGNSFGGGNLFIKPKDLAKIGLLILQNGIWMGSAIVSEEWIKESLYRFHLWDYGFHYGYLWYIKDEVNDISGDSYVTYSAAGSGGQKLLIVPELNMILVATSNVDYFKDRSYFLNLMIPKFILPAVINSGVKDNSLRK
jgi:CubicO group peptidase (beta-lactamase class C family)